jgi:multicomponent Na+:H+ antiporter subunit D
MLPWLKRTATISLDVDWIYRRLLPSIASRIARLFAPALGRARERISRALESTLSKIYQHHGPEGALARSWPTGSMVMWVAILLACYLLLYYV